MKYIHLVTLSLLFFVSHSLTGQYAILDYSEISAYPDIHFQADVDGKVLVQEDFFTKSIYPAWLNGITLFPDWPLSYTGSSTRGGIYCNLDEDEELEIVYCVSQEVHAWNLDGTDVDGWPVTVSYFSDGAPAFGDIDGDGEGEVVISSRNAGTGNSGSLAAFHKDGSAVEGFPVSLNGGATKTPVLADLNGDGIHEILIEERDWPDGYLGVYSGDGSPYPGFPVTLDYIPASSVAVGDITGDNVPEIVAESYYSIIAYDNAGNVLDGFPFTPGNERVFSYSSPVLADLDGDGIREILAADHSLASGNGAVHVLKNDGSALEGWPQYTSHWIYGPVAVGDIDGDGALDVAVGDQVLAGTPSNRVHVWDNEGNDLAGWPTELINSINNQIILADLDGDDEIELMWDDNTGSNIYLGYNHDGTPMEGWPLNLNGSSFFMNPFVSDVNGDATLDISGASTVLSDNSLDFYLWDAGVDINEELLPLPILQYNVRHDGNYVDESLLNANFIASAVDFCKGSEVLFTDLSTGEITSWVWTFEGGDPATSTDQYPSIYYADAGNFDVELTVSDGIDEVTTLFSKFIKVSDDAVVPDMPTGPDLFSTDTLNSTVYETWAPNAVEYIWELNPDDVAVMVAGDTITQVKIYWSSDPGYYAVLKVKAMNACGESEFSEELEIYVNWSVGMDVPDQSTAFSLFPNPSNGRIYLSNPDLIQNGILRIFDSSGKQMKGLNAKKISEYGYFSLEEPGIYYVHFQDGATSYSEKIIVR